MKKIAAALIAFGRILGTMNTYVILTMLFITVIVPVGFIRRTFGRHPLRSFGGSTWVRRDRPETLERQY